LKRSILFIIPTVIIIASCIFNGIHGEYLTISTINKMLATGKLTGKFWRIIDVQHDKIAVTKYKKKVNLVWSQPELVKKGDRISFVASSDNLICLKNDLLLRPTKIKIHGTSVLKFQLSILSIIIVLIMFLRSIRFDRKTLSLTFRME